MYSPTLLKLLEIFYGMPMDPKYVVVSICRIIWIDSVTVVIILFHYHRMNLIISKLSYENLQTFMITWFWYIINA
jgi:hypothetical protein